MKKRQQPQKSEFEKYAELEEPITLEEVITVIHVNDDTPHGLLGEWASLYPNIRATVHTTHNRLPKF